MSVDQITYLTFGIVLVFALVLDLGLMSKKNSSISIKKALFQTIFWVGLSIAFAVFLWFEKTPLTATKYFTAYLMEWSLSIDNIFVFILIFTFFKVEEGDAGRALLVGILLAIVFRIIFIAIGIELIDRFHWILYIFGFFLLYTGYKLFLKKDEAEFDPANTKIYQWINQFFRVSLMEPKGRYFVKLHGKVYFTTLTVVVIILASVDVAFALDSIPTVVSLVRQNPKIPFSSDDIMVIYSSNIFAILGLRSLFFLLKGAADKFDYLQQGIAVVLIFIGIKMLIEYFHIHIDILVSLGVIVVCLVSSILYSQYHNRRKAKADLNAS
ncbi:MAG: TerC/Alx family metal homeostasis membrane protein [Bacteroidota bacterium]|jgi:tellurite resistance protein TerC|nr:TerC/Alx family metal homeostasis membrane protein [Bacteroidota bacterium]